MTQNIFLVFGSLMSKIILALFVCIGAGTMAEHLKTNYSLNYQILYGGTIMIWLLLGAIYEYREYKRKEMG